MLKRNIWIAIILLLVGIVLPFAANLLGAFIREYPNPFLYFELSPIFISIINLLPVAMALFSFLILAKRLPFPLSAIPAMTGYYWLFQFHFYTNITNPKGEQVLGLYLIPPFIGIFVVIIFLLMLPFFFFMKKWHEDKSFELASSDSGKKIPSWLRIILNIIGCSLLFFLFWFVWSSFWIWGVFTIGKNFHFWDPAYTHLFGFLGAAISLFFFVRTRRKDENSESIPLPISQVPAEKIPFRLRVIFTLIGYGLLFLLPWIFERIFIFEKNECAKTVAFLITVFGVPIYIAIIGFFIPQYLYKRSEMNTK